MTFSGSHFIAPPRPERKTGRVLHFDTLSEVALRSMKQDLGFQMTVKELSFCQTHYRAGFEPRSPILEELYFFDCIAMGRRLDPDFVGLSSFYLNDPCAMETFQDILKKNKTLHKGVQKHPPTLTGLAKVLSSYLLRCGKESAQDRILSADLFESVALAASGFRLEDELSFPGHPAVQIFQKQTERATPLYRTVASDGDAILLLTTESVYNNRAIDASFLDLLSAFASSDHYRAVSALRVVRQSGIAAAVADMADGAFIDISKLPGVTDGGILPDLATEAHGSCLVSVDQKYCEEFRKAAEEYGLTALQIARAIRGNRMTVRRMNAPPIPFATPFLRAFSSLSAPFLIESAGQADAGDSITSGFRVNADCPFLQKTDPVSVFRLDNTVYSVSGSLDNGFRSGLTSAVLSVLQAVLGGANPEKLQLSSFFSYLFQFDSREIGDLFASFLGVYRTAAEIPVHMTASYLPGETGFSVWSHAPAADTAPSAPIGNRFVSPGSPVYLVTMPTKDSSAFPLPDFQNFRTFLHFLSDAVRENQILSASVAFRRTPVSVIAEMCEENGIAYHEACNFDSLNCVFPLPFLILECREKLARLQEIGTVRVLEDTAVPANTEKMVQENLSVPGTVNHSRIRIAQPVLSAVSLHENSRFSGIRRLCKEAGPSCEFRYSDTLEDALLSSSVVFFPGSTSETDEGTGFDNRRAYALEEFLKKDGILLIGECAKGLFEKLGFPVTVFDKDLIQSGIFICEASEKTGLSKETLSKILDFYR